MAFARFCFCKNNKRTIIISDYQLIADLEREGDVDVVQLRVLDARDLMGSISSCSSFAMQNGGATPTRGTEAAALDQKNRGE